MSPSPYNNPNDTPDNTIDAVPAAPTETTSAFPDYFASLPLEIQNVERNGRKPKLYNLMRYAPDVYARVLKYIEMGAYGHVAAEAMGISYKTWMEWLRKGERSKTGTIYGKFVADVRRAESKARIVTELQVRRDNPEFWLKNGPGKSTKLRPEGWTEIETTDNSLSNLIGHGRKEDVSNADLAETLRAAQELGLVNLLLSPPPSDDEDEDDDN